LQRGKAYQDYHLVMLKDQIDRNRMRIQSIPLVLVKGIVVFQTSKRQLMKINRRKFTIHFKDGSVKHIGSI
jgi:hypothetical protein